MKKTHGIWTICVTYPFWAGVTGVAQDLPQPPLVEPLNLSIHSSHHSRVTSVSLCFFFFLFKLIEYEQELLETLVSSSEFINK